MGASGIVRDNNCTALGGFSGFSSTGSPALASAKSGNHSVVTSRRMTPEAVMQSLTGNAPASA